MVADTLNSITFLDNDRKVLVARVAPYPRAFGWSPRLYLVRARRAFHFAGITLTNGVEVTSTPAQSAT